MPSAVKIVPYTARFAAAFKALNEDWISEYFEIEDADRAALERPQEYILDQGGHIYVALVDDRAVGVCALIRRDPDCFELAKMAVSRDARGLGVGWLLGETVIEKARQEGAARVFLESNTRLKPAVGLYRKLGFIEIKDAPSPYKRCNIQMEKML